MSLKTMYHSKEHYAEVPTSNNIRLKKGSS